MTSTITEEKNLTEISSRSVLGVDDDDDDGDGGKNDESDHEILYRKFNRNKVILKMKIFLSSQTVVWPLSLFCFVGYSCNPITRRLG